MEQTQSDEQMVRGVWEDVRICSQLDLNGRNMAYWWVIANGKGPLSKTVEKSEAQTWMALAAYTRERLEEVLQLREEIEMLSVCEHEAEHNAERAIFSRVIARLEAIVTGKIAGMKEGA